MKYNQIDQLADHRRGDSQQLWITGCSISHGIGVGTDQKYGCLLSKKLNLPVSFLTSPGSSPEWAADQILRSDVRASDFVIWGLTYEGRTPWWTSENDQLLHVTLGGLQHKIYEKSNLKFDVPESTLLHLVSSDSRIYKSVTSVKQVANYCSKVKAKLLVIGLMPSETVVSQLTNTPEFELISQFKKYPEYIDLGTDNSHPGPLQHQFYAEFCFKQMQRRDYI